MSLVPVSAAVALLGALLLPAGTSTAAYQPMCLNHTATIVGSPGATVQGTEQDDVIVSNGAREVNAGGGNDRICVTHRGSWATTTYVNAGAGSDKVEVTVLDDGVPRFRYQGGPGRDALQMDGGMLEDVSVVADLPRHRISFSRPDQALVTLPILNVQNLHAVRIRDVTMVGNASRNQFVVGKGCRSNLRGGSGDDKLFALRVIDSDSCGTVMRAGAGDDFLRGTKGDDVLLGETGTDSAYGQDGTDRCRAESVWTCEL